MPHRGGSDQRSRPRGTAEDSDLTGSENEVISDARTKEMAETAISAERRPIQQEKCIPGF